MTPAIFQDRAGKSAKLILRNQSIAVFGDGGRIGNRMRPLRPYRSTVSKGARWRDGASFDLHTGGDNSNRLSTRCGRELVG